jgi:hypothetical protein
MLEPKRASPRTDSALPCLAKLRNDSELPIWMMSKIDTLDPNRTIPSTVKLLDIRAKFRRDSELPK